GPGKEAERSPLEGPGHEHGTAEELVVGALALRQVLDCPPGEVARRGVAILPAIHRGQRDLNPARELLLGHAEPLPEVANRLPCFLYHVIFPSCLRIFGARSACRAPCSAARCPIRRAPLSSAKCALRRVG